MGASEPITLTDPDGAVTRVAPWSSWTREQVRAPGGEPALVTRLDSGQLWFAAGRRRSPWRHEVHVGPAVVSTPKGRFHATAEPDGGATIACLAGRTRVVAGLREPVLLAPDQSAAVSSDGRTLVVIERAALDGDQVINLRDEEARDAAEHETGLGALAAAVVGHEVDEPAGEDAGGSLLGEDEAAAGEAVPALAGAGSRTRRGEAAGETGDRRREGDGRQRGRGGAEAVGAGAGAGRGRGAGGAGSRRRRRSRWSWLPEVAAVAAVVALVIAGIATFGGGSDGTQQAGRPPARTDAVGPRSTTTQAPTTTLAPTTTTAAPTTTTQAPSTTTTRPRTVAPGAIAVGELQSCRRAAGGVAATVSVRHRSGGASSFVVKVGLVDGSDQVFAQGEATSPTIQPGGTVTVTVPITATGSLAGSCQLLGVSAG